MPANTDTKLSIMCLSNGPYYLLNDMTPKVVNNLQDQQGNSFSTVSGIALCRCGRSNNKPFCDGTHGTIGFSDKKKTDGNSDKRVSYTGKKITIHDNRGICAHAGICTDNLKAVFRMNQEPWIDPDAADVEAIIETIEQCPSGALSYSIDGTEYRDQQREPMVTVIKSGPYVITGGIGLIDQAMGEEASAEHYTLCRCGASSNKPFCDGSHWEVDFDST